MEVETYPQFLIQSDWDSALKSDGYKAWVTLKYKDRIGTHGTIYRSATPDGELTTTGGFKVIQSDGNSLHIGHESTRLTTIFLAPFKSVSDIHQKSIVSIGVNRSGHAVTAGLDERLLISDPLVEQVKFELKGHVGDVYRSKFFPSGEVVLSCGSDMRLMIWCAKTGVKAVTLTGHTMAVTDADFVDRGRNVISVSKDGALKLWNCGDSSCLATVLTHTSGINCCVLFTPPPGTDLGEPVPMSSEEFGTLDKAVLLGCEDGKVLCVALCSRTVLFSVDSSSAVNCVANVDDSSFLIGCQDGSLHWFSTSSDSAPKKSWFSSNSTVLSLLPFKDVGFFTSRADGNVTFTFFNIPTVIINLTGANIDPVYDLAVSSDTLFSCSRDSLIRMYLPFKLISLITGKLD